jgi:ATP-dependent DNA helicase RecQ
MRRTQRDLIQTVLAARNALGILPTGAGKSLCFQLPAL